MQIELIKNSVMVYLICLACLIISLLLSCRPIFEPCKHLTVILLSTFVNSDMDICAP